MIMVYRIKLVMDGIGKMIVFMFFYKIILLIVCYMRIERELEMGKIYFLGFYIVDDRGFFWYIYGFLGKYIVCFVCFYLVI